MLHGLIAPGARRVYGPNGASNGGQAGSLEREREPQAGAVTTQFGVLRAARVLVLGIAVVFGSVERAEVAGT